MAETMDGVPVTEEQIQAWQERALAGYDVGDLRQRGRPRLGAAGPSAIIPVRMDEELLTALNQKAQRDGLSRSEAIRAAVRTWARVA